MRDRKNCTWWIWVNENAEPVFVGWGRYQKQGKYGLKDPSRVVYDRRFDFESDLNLWLRTQELEPVHAEPFKLHREFLTAKDAKDLAILNRNGLKAKGVVLLNPKPYDSMRGGGKSKAVTGPYGPFSSVRGAARAIGVDPASITIWCQSSVNGWRYLPSLENPTNENQDRN